jgi:hypothetical protein
MAGSSHVDIYLKLTDAASRNVLLERVIGTSYNTFASEFAMDLNILCRWIWDK